MDSPLGAAALSRIEVATGENVADMNVLAV
jgi:hypothetical protein